MRTIFLTSSPNGPRSDPFPGLDHRNGFTERLKKIWKDQARALIISSVPDDHAQSLGMAAHYTQAFANEGMRISSFEIWDHTTKPASLDHDCIFLSGGPTFIQGRFFEEIGLREKLIDYDGIVIGISAGTMNSAKIVYAQPEFPGDTADPNYVRFYPGLGLTDIQVLPHYQEEKDSVLDGLRVYEDITYADSAGNSFYAFPDGTYIYISENSELICGEAYLISDGKIKKISDEGDEIKAAVE